MIEAAKPKNIVIGPPPANGCWELTPQPADALDAAGIVVLGCPEAPSINRVATSGFSRLTRRVVEAVATLAKPL